MKKRIRRIIAFATALVLSLTVLSCGKKVEEETQTAASGPQASQTEEDPGWVYVPQHMELETTGMIYAVRQAGDFLYYPVTEWNEELGDYASSVCKYSLADGSVERLTLNGETGSINSMDVAADGCIYAFVYYFGEDDNGNFNNWQSVVKYDAAGETVYCTDVSELMARENVPYISGLAADENGRVYLAGENKVLLFEKDGGYAGCIELGAGGAGNRISAVGASKEGEMYACYTEGMNCSLVKVDFDKRAVGEPCGNFPGGSGSSLNVGGEKDFIVHDGSAVYEYDLATGGSKKLFSWLDSDINGTYVISLGVMTDGRIVAVTYDWNTGASELILLQKTPAEEVSTKETLVLGTLYATTELQQAVVEFNKANEEYRVTVKEYVGDGEWTENTWSDARTSFYNDVIAGNCPDILDLSAFDVKNLSAKGLFEDLGPYLEQSSVLNREDFLENVIEGNIYDGILVSIPKRFSVQTILGRTSDMGKEMGISLEGLMAAAEKNPDKNLLDYNDKFRILYTCMAYNEDSFVNWDTGECSFDSPAFIQMLEFANRVGTDTPEEGLVSYARLQEGDILLTLAGIGTFTDIQLYMCAFGGDVTCVGYPTLDGSPACDLTPFDAYGISAVSEKKEGAWDFIEFYLTYAPDTNHAYTSGFPSEKGQLQKELDALVKVEYVVDGNGDPVLDENGEPMERLSSYSVSYGGWTYEFHRPTEEEVQLTMDMINTAKVRVFWDGEIYSIVVEEAEAYFAGARSAGETADIIQSRVKLYVSESR